MTKENLTEIFTNAIEQNPSLAKSITDVYTSKELNDSAKINTIKALAKSSKTEKPKEKAQAQERIRFNPDKNTLIIRGAEHKRSYATLIKNEYEGLPQVLVANSYPIDLVVNDSELTISSTLKELSDSELQDVNKFLATLNGEGKEQTTTTKTKPSARKEPEQTKDSKDKKELVRQAKVLVDKKIAKTMEEALNMVGA